MIREIFLEDMSLWVCVWQSTLFAVIGLVGSFLLRRRPARASQVLFLAMIAAVLVPTMSVLVERYELGLFATEPIAITQKAPSNAITPDYGISVAEPTVDIQHEVRKGTGELTLAKADSRRANIPWRKVVLYGWMTATLILSGRLLVAFVSGIFLMRRAQSNGCEQIRRAADSARERLGITKDLQVRSSRDVHCPVIWCWSPAPILLVPDDLAHRIDWVGVIYHELAHWRRQDHISGLIAELVVCILSWNPLLWWAKKRMIKLSEQACDDWVLAGGQPCEDYAQSLLNFRPQKQAAFVPAVVSSKKTLTGRVHRILKDSCGNPRTGVAWALTASLVVLCLSVGIAFAQTRPSKPTVTIKTKVGSLAVIEQPASAMIIKGYVLNSDNKPAFARVIALPNTSYGARILLNNKEGYFELPWSPTWLDEGQSIYLIAKSGHMAPRGETRKHEAAIVEVTDPTQPLTIRLEPARLSLEGKVIDPNGQRIPKYRATLSLATEFKSQAPIFGTIVGFPRERIFSPIPYGTKYRLTIEAEGYQTKQLTVDATDRTKEVIDIGTITLQPQDPTKSVAVEQLPNPDLAKEFHEIYRLEAEEVFKLIKPPFVLGRQEYLLTTPRYSSFALQHPGHHCGFHWDGELKAHSFSSSPSLWWVLYYVLDIPEYDYNLPKELKVNLCGDWIVRADSPKDEQLRALEEIIYAELHRSIHFEKRKVEREVIVATGRYKFKPHPSGEFPNHVYLTWDGTLGNPERTVDSLAEIFRYLERVIKMKIVDETESMENTPIRYKESQNLGRIPHEPELRSERLSALLDNLARTTSLRFTVERQPAEIWFVTETREN